MINWNIVNRNVRPGFSVKEALARKIAGLAKHLAHFQPDTLHLQVVLEKLTRRDVYSVKLTLRLPSNILHVDKSDADLLLAIDSATRALKREVQSFKAHLHRDYRWKRPVRRAQLRDEQAIAFAEPMDEGTGPQTDAEVVADLLAAHDQYLLAHARRLVRMAELTGEFPEGSVEPRDIVDEAARVSLAHPERKPGGISHEIWFYRLIIDEMDRLRHAYSTERSVRAGTIGSINESSTYAADGYEPLPSLEITNMDQEPEIDVPADQIVDAEPPPDLAIAGREMVEALQQEIKRWPQDEQQVMELHYLMNFDIGDVAMICKQSKQEITALANKVQLRLREYIRTLAR